MQCLHCVKNTIKNIGSNTISDSLLLFLHIFTKYSFYMESYHLCPRVSPSLSPMLPVTVSQGVHQCPRSLAAWHLGAVLNRQPGHPIASRVLIWRTRRPKDTLKTHFPYPSFMWIHNRGVRRTVILGQNTWRILTIMNSLWYSLNFLLLRLGTWESSSLAFWAARGAWTLMLWPPEQPVELEHRVPGPLEESLPPAALGTRGLWNTQ